MVPGASWDTGPLPGNDPPLELSPHDFSELASELHVTDAQQRIKAGVSLKPIHPSLNIGTAPAAPPASHSLPITATHLSPPALPRQQPPPQQQQGGGSGPRPNLVAAQISRLYNHMLLQLPSQVQRRAQHHLIMRTAAINKSGLPVQQATMLVQQELLPIMQQAFMRLQQQAKEAGPEATSPSRKGGQVGAQQQRGGNNNGGINRVGSGTAAGDAGSIVSPLNASAMKTLAAGKAAAAPAIAATEAVIQRHRASRQGLVQPNEAYLVQQQQQQIEQAEQQWKQAALIQQQQEQRIQKLRAMQAIHMQRQQQQQQQQQQMVTGNANNLGAAAAIGDFTGPNSPLNGGPAQGLRHEMLAASSPNSSPKIAPRLPTAMSNIQSMNRNQRSNNEIPTEELATDLTAAGGSGGSDDVYNFQQKRQRTGGAIDDGQKKIALNENSVRGTGNNHFLQKWDDLFEGPSGTTKNTEDIDNNNHVNHNSTMTQQGIEPDDINRSGNGVLGVGVGAPDGCGDEGEDRPHQPSLTQVPPPPVTTATATMHAEPALNFNNVDPNAHASDQLHTKPAAESFDAAVGITAVSRGKVAAAKMHAKEATQRYSWTAGMLNEIFIPAPVDTTGLLKQEQKNALTLTTTITAAAADADAENFSTSVDHGGGGLPNANKRNERPPHPQQSCVASQMNKNGEHRHHHQEHGTEGQRMLADAAQRVHQNVVLPTAMDSCKDNLTAPMEQQEVEPDNTNIRIESNVSIVPVLMTVTKLQMAGANNNNTENHAAVEGVAGPVTEQELHGFDNEPPLQLNNSPIKE